ncbi:MAG: hypothetical protein LIP77_00870, partial [Planctomycetes bacterium]|nr:hypothetical protein [Planctomycetota bacterium]
MILRFLARSRLLGLSLDEEIEAAAATDFQSIPIYIHNPTRRKQLTRLLDRYFPLKRARYYP